MPYLDPNEIRQVIEVKHWGGLTTKVSGLILILINISLTYRKVQVKLYQFY
jgi:hypothetical protein